MSDTPRRVKVTGDRYHGHVPEGAVYVGRQAPGLRRSKFANPFKTGDKAADIASYREYLHAHPELVTAARAELAGRDLACWCGPGEPCHASVLIEIANG